MNFAEELMKRFLAEDVTVDGDIDEVAQLVLEMKLLEKDKKDNSD